MFLNKKSLGGPVKVALVLSPVILAMLMSNVQAQTVRTVPSYKSTDAPVSQTTMDQAAVSELTKRLTEKLRSPSSKYKLSPEQIEAVARLSQDPNYSQFILAIVNSTTQIPGIVQVNQLRLEILAQVGAADAMQNAEKVRDLGTLAARAKPEALNAESLKNLALYLDAIKKGIDQKVATQDLLLFAQQIMENGEGKIFEIQYIDQASKTKDGVNEIFYARSESRIVKIGNYDAGDGKSYAIEVKLSLDDAQKIEDDANKKAADMIDRTLSPQGRDSLSLQRDEEVSKDLDKSTEDVALFLKGNKVLDRHSDHYKKVDESRLKSIDNINELLGLLKDMGYKVGEKSVKGWLAARVRSAPLGVGKLAKKFVPDPIDMLKTHRSKIEEVDNALKLNAAVLQENSAEIDRVLTIMASKLFELKIKMATDRLIADKIREAAADLRSQNRVEEAERLEATLGLKVEKALNYAMGQVAASNLIGEVMNQQIGACTALREEISSVRNTAMPLFTANAMADEILDSMQQAAATGVAVKAAVSNQLTKLQGKIAETNTLIIQMEGQPVLSSEKMSEMTTFLMGQRERMEKAHLENYRKLQDANMKSVEPLNRIEASMGAELASRCTIELSSLGNTQK